MDVSENEKGNHVYFFVWYCFVLTVLSSQFADKSVDLKYEPSFLILYQQSRLVLAGAMALYPTQVKRVVPHHNPSLHCGVR